MLSRDSSSRLHVPRSCVPMSRTPSSGDLIREQRGSAIGLPQWTWGPVQSTVDRPLRHGGHSSIISPELPFQKDRQTERGGWSATSAPWFVCAHSRQVCTSRSARLLTMDQDDYLGRDRTDVRHCVACGSVCTNVVRCGALRLVDSAEKTAKGGKVETATYLYLTKPPIISQLKTGLTACMY
ncbi:hypothetical protein F5Y15DRAFT_302350 [Xylariaceae sp. FL0016]|nr:hypothetical protein F5Y15DRAFT_302350 [Xylariaceae sp. FL0016]